MTNYIGVILNVSEFPLVSAYGTNKVFNEPGYTRDEDKRVARNLEIFTQMTPMHKYKATGTVTVNSIPAVRTLRLYREGTGEIISETMSSITGAYTLTTPYNEDHYVVCLDALGGEDFNHLIRKNVDIVSI